MNESKLNLLTLRSGDFFNLDHLSLLVEQPREGSWLYQGNTRIATEQDASSIAEGLDAGWVRIPCVVARRGTHQGVGYMIWTRPRDVERVTRHSSGRASLVAVVSGRVLVSPHSSEEIQAMLKGELHPSFGFRGVASEPSLLEVLSELADFEVLHDDRFAWRKPNGKQTDGHWL